MMRKKITLFDFINIVLVILITLLVLYPLYFCVIASFSAPDQVALGKTMFTIKNFTVEAYSNVLKEKQIWVGYRHTIIYTFFGTIYNLVLTIPIAYAMTKQFLPFRNIISWFFFITMYFSGGMIPSYLLIKDLNLINNPLVLVLGAGVSCYNMIVTRQYFSSTIPQDIYEAANIDGASEIVSFTRIALPLAKPIIAVMALYYGCAHWNNYYNALLYIRDKEYYPLQLVLRGILITNQMAMNSTESLDVETAAYMLYKAQLAQTMKYAVVFIASAPLLIVYPFLQKYFTKGMMIGSIKG